jgi:hypothetical protein
MHSETAAADAIDLGGSGANPSPLSAEPLITVPLGEQHKTAEFVCAKSPRVAGFFAKEALVLVPGRYCRIFILPSPNDPTEIWGYYTLSAGILLRDNMSRKDGGNALPYPAPVVRIGFMGRSDRAEPGIGRGLISDAARRVYRNPDIAAWGLVLESEDGPQNKKLWEWYQKQGFKPCRQTENTMYGPLSAFLPELQPVEN